MGKRSILLLALAVGSGAFELDSSYLEGVTSNIHDYFSSSLRSLLHEHANPRQATLPDNKTTCGECVRGGAKFVIEHTMSKMKDKCAAANSDQHCVMSKVCTFMSKHPDVGLGMMMEHVRPMSLSMAYCYGKGECKKPDEVTMEEIATGHEPHEALLDNFDKVDWSEIEEATEELMPLEHKDGQMGEAPTCKGTKHMKVCPHCMKAVMRRVMGMAVMKVKKMCMDSANSKCPMMQKLCPWMAQHKQVALGMLIAKVEPWKFAFGHCFHKKKHHHHDWHHGEHHGVPQWLYKARTMARTQWQQVSQDAAVPISV